jgi:hypothetical protein
MRRVNRDKAKEQFWRAALLRQAKCGLSQTKFCAQEGLNLATFTYWKDAIKHRDAELDRNEAPTKSPSFVPVVVTPDKRDSAARTKPVAEVHFGSGSVSIFAGADVNTLRALLIAVKECCL